MKARATIMKAEPLLYGDKTEYKDPLSLQVAAAETPLLPVYWGLQHKDVDRLGSRESHVGNARIEWNGYDAIEGDVELFEDLPDDLAEMIAQGVNIPLSCWYTCDLDGSTQTNHHLKHILLTKEARSPNTMIYGDSKGVIERVIVGDTINFNRGDASKDKNEVTVMPDKPPPEEPKPEEPKKAEKKVELKPHPDAAKLGTIPPEKDLQEYITMQRDQLKALDILPESAVDSMKPGEVVKTLQKHATKPEAGIQEKPAPAGLPPPKQKDAFAGIQYDKLHGAQITKDKFVKDQNEAFEAKWGKPAAIDHTKPPLITGEGFTSNPGPKSILRQKLEKEGKR